MGKKLGILNVSQLQFINNTECLSSAIPRGLQVS